MTIVDRNAVTQALRELSDLELQQRLWLSNGSNDSEVSSFTEAVEELYTDTGLSIALRSGNTGFDLETNKLLLALKNATRQVDVRHGPTGTINDPTLRLVREIASKILLQAEQRRQES